MLALSLVGHLSVNGAGDSILLLRQPGAGGEEVAFAPFRARIVTRNNGDTSIGLFDADSTPSTPPVWVAH
jgi:hypothetical protein